MAIYVDELQDDWCHMWASDGDHDALDRFALSIGLKLSWCQISYGAFVGEFVHFDLRPSKRELALKRGAVAFSLHDWIKQMRAREQQQEMATREERQSSQRVGQRPQTDGKR